MTHLTADHRPADEGRAYRLTAAWADGDAVAAQAVIAEALDDDPTDPATGLARVTFALTGLLTNVLAAAGHDPGDLMRAALLDLAAKAGDQL